MEKAKIKKIWLNDSGVDLIELRLDWDNDRHHGITIKPPFGVGQVTDAMELALRLINVDSHLK